MLDHVAVSSIRGDLHRRRRSRRPDRASGRARRELAGVPHRVLSPRWRATRGRVPRRTRALCTVSVRLGRRDRGGARARRSPSTVGSDSVAVGARLTGGRATAIRAAPAGARMTHPGRPALLSNPLRGQGGGAELQALRPLLQVDPLGSAAPPPGRSSAPGESGSRVRDVAWADNTANGRQAPRARGDRRRIPAGSRRPGHDGATATGSMRSGARRRGPPIGHGELGDVALDLVDASRVPLRVVGHVQPRVARPQARAAAGRSVPTCASARGAIASRHGAAPARPPRGAAGGGARAAPRRRPGSTAGPGAVQSRP